jgi:FKBP-type peptidyl-prolyl cis-trans isomerase 2
MIISDGSTVTLEYTLSLDDGEIVDSTEEEGPLTFVHGSGELMPSIERAMVGMAIGERKELRIEADEAFGQPHTDAVMEIPRAELPQDLNEPGMMLVGCSTDGEEIEGTVLEVKQDTVLVDFNHPLAGKALRCSLHVTDVRNDSNS